MEFKNMPLPKKIEHIWEYYKIHIFAVIFAVGAVIWLVNRFIINPAPKMYTGIAIYGPHVSIEEINRFNDYINEKVIPDGVNEAVETTNFFFTEGTESEDAIQDADMLNKFNTYMFSLQLDIFIGTEDDLRSCVKSEYVDPITEYLGEDRVKELEDAGLVIYDSATENGEEQPFGISLENSGIINGLESLKGEKWYLGFVPIEGREEKAANTAEAIIN